MLRTNSIDKNNSCPEIAKEEKEKTDLRTLYTQCQNELEKTQELLRIQGNISMEQKIAHNFTTEKDCMKFKKKQTFRLTI